MTGNRKGLVTFDPWETYAELARTTGLSLRWTVDEGELEDAYAWYTADRHQILMDARLSDAEQRSTLAHECFHAMNRHRPTGSRELDLAQEWDADMWAAERLVDLQSARLLHRNGVSVARLAQRFCVIEDLVEIRLGLPRTWVPA